MSSSAIHMLMRSWWILALRGLVAVLFGIAALALPAVTLLSLIAVFAVYALLAGTVSVVGALGNRQRSDDWWILLALGVCSLVAGVLAAMYPALTGLALVLVIGINALVTGALDIVLALRLRKAMRGESLLIVSAAVSLLFGFLVLAYPAAGALVLVWLIGGYALLTGALYLVLAYRVYRGNARRPRLVADLMQGGARKGVERRVAERRTSGKPAGS
ncbi:putative membrane protein [Janthinobacterium agaricidamnosum NBRC 102515 = DSM 9628]|uniref:Putative membrane protein n=2 Tax=Janthinobacterium agaricidamnosum TaxID=55508 RepID=W0V3Z6_9BURK|nr:HdeD family acid-resistance protein [Janthinobacterium agaricidamnosum]CDG82073.1 putative membrane protein [Janthinobacterium agaricidamnosum NBRC 102515 = DSM 9628]